jgi:hypothetical protein
MELRSNSLQVEGFFQSFLDSGQAQFDAEFRGCFLRLLQSAQAFHRCVRDFGQVQNGAAGGAAKEVAETLQQNGGDGGFNIAAIAFFIKLRLPQYFIMVNGIVR